MIAIVDYGAGNLRSVAKAIERLGYPARVTEQPEDIVAADAVILPGVGAAGDAMAGLRRLGLVGPLRQIIAGGKPFLGVCLGLQVLLTGSEEGGWQDCLNVIPGVVRRLPPGLKVPHMGWNQVQQRLAHPIFAGIPDKANFYFVHSYAVHPERDAVIAGETEYGVRFCSAIARDNLVATQFHPEKSGDLGLKMFDNFCRWAGVKRIE
ncbi:MAG: imidazole glycerol phosphate synthase subunit HisH [Chloroflexi bacterium]|nr:imidazole glycerol phosphate synthase subunit HisH [Chloroflexota bacterium]